MYRSNNRHQTIIFESSHERLVPFNKYENTYRLETAYIQYLVAATKESFCFDCFNILLHSLKHF